MKKIKYIILSIILLGYAALYTATSYQVPCEDDCEKVSRYSQALQNSRDYVFYAGRCTNIAVSDTLCVYVKDTIGINWNLLADTACNLAAQNNLHRQKIFFIKRVNSIPDTILVRQCP